MYHFNPEKYTLVQCLDTQEVFGIRAIYQSIFENAHKEVIFPCHKFNEDGDLEEIPTVFKTRSLLNIALVEGK